MSTRKLAVSGQFYPDDINELKRYIEHFNSVLENNSIQIDTKLNPRAIIVPHAGYIYSGFTANIAYKYIPKNSKNIIVIGPSHKYGFNGASVSNYNLYPTPFGDLTIDKKLSQELIDTFEFLEFYDEVHSEHSTETQFPFIKYYLPEVNVLEIIYSQCEYQELSKIIEYLLKDQNNFIVISTDLSHFYSLEEAKKKDLKCLEAIDKKDINLLNTGCEACGMIGVKGILEVISKFGLNTKLLDYRTSADISNDTSSVVGYTSFVIHT